MDKSIKSCRLLNFIAMEPKIRGVLEKILDLATSDSFLQPYVKICTKLKNEGAIDSIKSAVIGAVHLYVVNSYLSMKVDKKDGISEEEEKELDEIFLRRIPEIKSKLDILLNI